MFTGLIETMGTIRQVMPKGDYLAFTISPDSPFADMTDGESIAVSGPCLTVVRYDEKSFEVEASQETLRVTTLKTLRAGSRVNLERALRADSRLGGHFVTGHIDGVLRVKNLAKSGRSLIVTVGLPADDAPLVVDKGSVTLDGISLTVVGATENDFTVNIIPETQIRTTWNDVKVGGDINVEFDLIGKYILRVFQQRQGAGKLTIERLREMGY